MANPVRFCGLGRAWAVSSPVPRPLGASALAPAWHPDRRRV